MKKKILIVEDEEPLLNSLKLTVKSAGYDVETAKDGEEAYEKFMDTQNSGKPFDLVLTDVVMPKLGGLGLLEKLNRNKNLVPVIALTGHADRKTMLQMILKGCDGYILKPLDSEKLIDRVNNVFIDQTKYQ